MRTWTLAALVAAPLLVAPRPDLAPAVEKGKSWACTLVIDETVATKEATAVTSLTAKLAMKVADRTGKGFDIGFEVLEIGGTIQGENGTEQIKDLDKEKGRTLEVSYGAGGAPAGRKGVFNNPEMLDILGEPLGNIFLYVPPPGAPAGAPKWKRTLGAGGMTGTLRYAYEGTEQCGAASCAAVSEAGGFSFENTKMTNVASDLVIVGVKSKAKVKGAYLHSPALGMPVAVTRTKTTKGTTRMSYAEGEKLVKNVVKFSAKQTVTITIAP